MHQMRAVVFGIAANMRVQRGDNQREAIVIIQLQIVIARLIAITVLRCNIWRPAMSWLLLRIHAAQSKPEQHGCNNRSGGNLHRLHSDAESATRVDRSLANCLHWRNSPNPWPTPAASRLRLRA